MAAPRVLVFADSGPRIGGGHVMRCLTLARALAQRGAACAFAATPAAQAILRAFAPPDIQVFPVSGDVDQAPGAAASWAQSFAADWVLLDHYFLPSEQEAALRQGRRLAVLDDLADRPRAADLVINSAYGCTAGLYDGLLPTGAVILAGPAFAPVRPEFAHRRAAALAHRREGGHLKHLLISLGLTDVEGITARVVAALRPHIGDMILDVVLGSAAPSLPALCAAAKTDPCLRLHIDSHAMAELTAAADIAVGAGGSSAWERCTLGLPAVTVILADNQRPMAQVMARDGLTLAVDATGPDFENRLTRAVQTLVSDAALRRSISEKSAAACDGLGAERVAQAMVG